MSSPGGLGSTSHFTQHSAFGYVLGYHYSALRARFSLDPFHTRTKTRVLTQTLTPWAMIVPPFGLLRRGVNSWRWKSLLTIQDPIASC